MLNCIFKSINSNAVEALLPQSCGTEKVNGTRSFWKLSNEEKSGTQLIFGAVIFEDEEERYEELMQRLNITEDKDTDSLNYATPLDSSYWKPSKEIKCDKLNFPLRTQDFYDDMKTTRYFDDLVNFKYLVATSPQVEPK